MRYTGFALLLGLLGWPSSSEAQESQLLSSLESSPHVWGALEVPEGPGPHPAVILLHGSAGWRSGYVNIAREFADSGFAALILDYYAETGGAAVGSDERLQRWEAWRQAVRDAASFLQSLPFVTGDRIALVGFSRGGFLGVSVAASMPSVIAVVDLFGGGGGGTLALEEEVRGLPPLLVLHGEDDMVVPVSFAHNLRAAVLEAGGQVEMHLYPGEAHAFNAPWAGTYSEGAAEDAFSRAVAFLKARFGS